MRTLLLACLLLVCCLANAQDPRTYFITAPKIWRVEAHELVMVQLIGYTTDDTVYLSLRSSMARDAEIYFDASVLLTTQNSHQEEVTLQLTTKKLLKDATHVILWARANEFSQYVEIPISKRNGFLFVQTDKPLYTPEQSVKVRAFALTEELTAAKRNVFLKFRDPDKEIVEMVELQNDLGLPSLQEPFKIPFKPKLGLWSIEASYGEAFATLGKAQFEVKEYVLPSITIDIEPEDNYISYGNFEQFNLNIKARYVHGAPMSEAAIYLRFGYFSGKNSPVILQGSIRRERLMKNGALDVAINVKKTLAKNEGPQTLNDLMGKNLYVVVTVAETKGGLSQEAELTSVKFLLSPYTLRLVATPPFIKPLLPYTVRVLVQDHLGDPVPQVLVKMLDADTKDSLGKTEKMDCAFSDSNTNGKGVATFKCNILANTQSAKIKLKTADNRLPEQSQAEFVFDAQAYHSPNKRYLYLNLPSDYNSLQVGNLASIDVVFASPTYLQLKTFSYLVINNGRVVKFGTLSRIQGSTQVVNFEVTPAMVPSIRFLVYYVLHGEDTSELVADSVWFSIMANCMNNLKTEISYGAKERYEPNDRVELQVKTKTDSLVALAAVDTALYSLRSSSSNPINKMLRHIEKTDPGCGGGGGKDNADVFRLAGLTFMTNANAKAASSKHDECTDLLRPKRALTYEQKKEKSKQYGIYVAFCWHGLKQHPVLVECSDRAKNLPKESHKVYTNLSVQKAKEVFIECCEFSKSQPDTELWNARVEMGLLFDQSPTHVRSAFPESWLWEVHGTTSGMLKKTVTLPDSLTTWEFSALALYPDGLCVANPKQLSVTKAVSVNVPLPYSMTRGEQIELLGSVYNRDNSDLDVCVTLTAGPGVCLYQGVTVEKDGSRTTPCEMKVLKKDGVGEVSFTLLALETGSISLTFTLHSSKGILDKVLKSIHVKPEGVLSEKVVLKKLDPTGLYGAVTNSIEIPFWAPEQVVPHTDVDRQLIITGEIIGEVMSIIEDHEGLEKLLTQPLGSGEAEIMKIIPYYYVYHFLEQHGRWGTMDSKQPLSPESIKRKMREGLVSIKSYRNGDGSYSMWRDKEPITWLTSLVVKTIAQVETYVDFQQADYESLLNTIFWLIQTAQLQDGSFKETSPTNHILNVKQGTEEYSVYLTSFVMISLKQAQDVESSKLKLKDISDSLQRAADYVSKNAKNAKSIYVRAVATYALLLHDLRSEAANTLYEELEKQSREKGNPVILRFWQNKNAVGKPDQVPPQTVEITSYILLCSLLKNKLEYALPVVRWLTEDQHYGGFQSQQDTLMAMGVLTQYSLQVENARLDLVIDSSYKKGRDLMRVRLNQQTPVARPIQLKEDKSVKVSTGGGSGLSKVKVRTVYYKLAENLQKCNFETTINVYKAEKNSHDPMKQVPHMVVCAMYKPPPGEDTTESLLTIMEIQLPTGVVPSTEDLDYQMNSLEAVISFHQIDKDLLILQVPSVPSSHFLCVGFRIQQNFKVGLATDRQFRIFEAQARQDVCSRMYSPLTESKLQRLCVGEQCLCLTAECSPFRNDMNRKVTAQERIAETCHRNVKYALKVQITSLAIESDFVVYTAKLLETLKKEVTENLARDSDVELIKKNKCNSVDLKNGEVYLVLPKDKIKTQVDKHVKYRFILDSQTPVEIWPSKCTENPCSDFVKVLDDYEYTMTYDGCPKQ